MSNSDFDKAKFLYNIAVSSETQMEAPDDIALSIQNMLAEIRALGHSEFLYFTDVKLRKINDKQIMKVLLKYYNEMDLFTRDSLMHKIHPKYFPEVLDIAKKEFLNLSPSTKRELNGFQVAMGKGNFSEEYTNEMLGLLENGEYYANLGDIRKKIAKKHPQKLIPLIEKYSKSALILCAICDCGHLSLTPDIIEKLERWSNISDDEIKIIRSRENNRELTVTTYEYYLKFCNADRIRADARSTLKKLKKKEEIL